MRLSKTRFINFIRCDRYPALEEIYQEKEKAVVAFVDDPELEDIMSEENKEKISYLLDDMEDDDDNDIIEKPDLQLKAMLKYYNEIEIISGQIIKKKFGGTVTYALDTYHQKRFEHEYQGFRFFCFLDGYQEDEDCIRIFEVKATTSKKFKALTYKNEDKEKMPLFDLSNENILMLQQDLLGPITEDYNTKVSRLKNRLSKEGRYVYDLAYQKYVLDHKIKTDKKVKYYLVVLNSDYIYDGKTDAKKQPIYGDDIIQFIDLTSFLDEMMPIINHDVDIVIRRLNMMNASPVPLGLHCQRKDQRICKFYPVCYKHFPKQNSIFSYMGNHHGFTDEHNIKHHTYDLINEGFISALDVPYTWLKRPNNIIQRDVLESNAPFIDLEKIKSAIATIKYPIYHLDFETFPCPLPRFKGEKPYSQSLFQFSIHVEHKPGVCDKNLDNHSFIATTHDDLREELIKRMTDIIKDDGGSVMVYNESFEKTRLKEMGIIFPEYQHKLNDISSRIFDLLYLVKTSSKLFLSLGFDEPRSKQINYYHQDLDGSFSIKKVLPIFSNLTYQGLHVSNGVEALVTYARFPEMKENEFKASYQDLLEYCKQDTWAMVEILAKLREMVKNSA